MKMILWMVNMLSEVYVIENVNLENNKDEHNKMDKNSDDCGIQNEDEEIDPLDAFMNDIDEQVKKEITTQVHYNYHSDPRNLNRLKLWRPKNMIIQN